MPAATRMPPLLAIASVSALAAVLANAAGGGDAGPVSDWTLTVTFAVSAVAVLWRGVRVPDGRPAWLLLGVGIALYAIGCVVFNVVYPTGTQAPFPSIADYLWSVVQPCAAIALILEGRRLRGRHGVAEVLDGLVCAFALAGLCGALVYQPIFAEAVDRGVTFGLVQPLMDLTIVAIVVVHLSIGGWRADRVLSLFGLSFLALCVGDSIYVVEAATSGYAPGTWTDLPYAICMVGLAFAAWTPTERPAAAHAHAWNLAVPIAAGLVGVGLASAALVTQLNPVAELATVLLLLAVVVRAGQAMRDYGRMLALTVHEANTDALTGLLNRRRLIEELSQCDGRHRRTLALFDLDGFKSYNDTFGHTAGDTLLVQLAASLRTAVAGRGAAYRMGGDEFCVLTDTDGAEDVLTACAAALRRHEDDIEISSSWGVVAMPDEAASFAEALGIADRRMYAMKNGRPRSAGSQLRDVLVRVLDIREPDLHDHVLDVGRLAGAVARRLGLPEHEIADIVHGAVLHDVGKLAVPQEILDKPGPLDDVEWEIMRRHTIEGEQFLAGIPALANVARLVRSSHERWDGAGYPDGLAGEDVPLGARIITVCDAYDAMVTDRPYRRGMPQAEALAELRRCAGTHFDATVVGAFCAMVEAHAEAGATTPLAA